MLLEDTTEGQSYIDARSEKVAPHTRAKEKTQGSIKSRREGKHHKKRHQQVPVPEKVASGVKSGSARRIIMRPPSFHLPRLVNGNLLVSNESFRTIRSSNFEERLPDVTDDDHPAYVSSRDVAEQVHLDRIAAATTSNNNSSSNNTEKRNKSMAFTIQMSDLIRSDAKPKRQGAKTSDEPLERVKPPQNIAPKPPKTPAPRPESRIATARRTAAAAVVAAGQEARVATARRTGPPPSSLAIPMITTTEADDDGDEEKTKDESSKTKLRDAIPEEKQSIMPVLASDTKPVEPSVKPVISLPPIFFNVSNSNGATSNNNVRQIESTFSPAPPLRGSVIPQPTPLLSLSQPQPSIAVPPKMLVGLNPRIFANPMDTELAIRLKTLVFGSQYRKPSDAWRLQSLSFAAENGTGPALAPRFVILQRPHTGSCTTGLLAVVQSELLKQILYCDYGAMSSKSIENRPLKKVENPLTILRLLTRSQRTDALSAALAEIIFRAATAPKSPFSKSNKFASLEQEHVAKVVIPCGRRVLTTDGTIAEDGLTEKLLIFTFPMGNDAALLKELRSFLRQHIVHYDTDGSGGVLLTLYSVVLSRGIDIIYSDMDDATSSSLITADSYSSTEAINLFLSGIATSYLFNDDMHISTSPATLSSSSSSSSILTPSSPGGALNNAPEITSNNGVVSSDTSGAASLAGSPNNSNGQSNSGSIIRHLKGIHHRCDVGYLTLSEYYATSGTLSSDPQVKKEQLEQMQLATVGSYLKTPRYPLWIAAMNANNTRYAVLYSTNIELISNWRAERLFDLFCLDAWMLPAEKMNLSLTNCLQPMRLRLDAIERPEQFGESFDDTIKKNDDDVEDAVEGLAGSIVILKKSPPPIELVLQTKWPGAAIDYLTIPDAQI